MTLPEAVAILNREKHRGYDGWVLGSPFSRWARNPNCFPLSAFESIAIAREYERLNLSTPAGPAISREMMKAGQDACDSASLPPPPPH